MRKNSKSGKLILHCNGGLGNQMFEYAAGRFFANQSGRTLEIVRPIPAHQKWGTYERPFQLSQFSIQETMREESVLDRLLSSTNPFLKANRNSIASMLNLQVIDEPIAYHYAPALPIDAGKKLVFINGYWQSAGYAQAIETDLREAFKLRSSLHERNQEYLEKILAMRCPVSVHCRIGDYAQIYHASEGGAQSVSNVLNPAYYERALPAIQAQCESVNFIVFSDDPSMARSLFGNVENCLFVEGNDTSLAHEELILMSHCRHHIIANSSFSWWGAWLNPNRDKIVYAPKYWGNTIQSYFPDLFPSLWSALDNI